MSAEIRIGTSGWHYKHWQGLFYPERCSSTAMFESYLKHFDTVEINNSFYRLPDRSTFAAWRNSTPSGFRFAVKASRFITHNKKLKDPQPSLERLFASAEALEEKLGPFLFQLPPKWKLNVDRLADFLAALPRRHRYTFEFRENSWNDETVFTLLRHYNAAYCVYELAGFHSPLIVTANWVYVRLHGPEGKYQGNYSNEQLSSWAKRVVQWARSLRAVYVYFDNDQAAYAAHNALRLRKLVEERLASRAA